MLSVIRLLHSRTAINIGAAILSFGMGLLIRFIATPYVVSRLGPAAYGFVGVSANILGVVSLLTVAVNSLSNRFIAVEYQSGKVGEAKSYYSSLIFANIVLSLLLALICAVVCANLEWVINIPSDIVFDVKVLFAILSANMIVLLFSSAWSVGAFILNRLDISYGIQIVGNLVQGVALVLLFWFGLGHIWYVGASVLAMGIAVAVGNYLAMRRVMPELRVDKSMISWRKIVSLVKAGSWNLVSRVSEILGQGLDLLIANIFLGATLAGTLAISRNVPFVVLGFFTAVVSAFVPMLLKRYAEGSHSQFAMVLFKAMKVCCIFAAMPMAFLMVFGEDFYSLWLPGQNQSLLNALTMLGCFNLAFAMPLECIWSIFTIANRLKWPTLFMLGNSALVFVTMVLGCCIFDNPIYKLYVVAGARAGWGMIRSLTFLPMYGAHVASVPPSKLYVPVVSCVLLLAVNLGMGMLAKDLFKAHSWGGLLLATFVFLSWCVACAMVFWKWRSILRALPIIRPRGRMIHFVHRMDRLNSGDMAACPIRYFSWPLRCREQDIDRLDMRWIKEGDLVILGGGGLFNCCEKWNRTINDILAKCRSVVAWSVGFNRHENADIVTGIAYDKFRIITIRDKGHPSGFEWLPCVSCMAVPDDLSLVSGNGIGVVSHRDHIIQSATDTIVSSRGLNDILKFISAHAEIQTNSYHAAYWALLLGRKVILEGADYSEKFRWMAEVRLEDAKRVNRAFYGRVMELLIK